MGHAIVTIRVRDGRFGRDPALADEDGQLGEILMTFERDKPYSIGEPITLPDGWTWPVIGYHEKFNRREYSQDVTIGEE
ncbi:MAG: hypothetical protein QOJ37_3853 [Pseudonocardiales bacterium]|nr:hypothetical protein [Pseudonocardiales bacterium]